VNCATSTLAELPTTAPRNGAQLSPGRYGAEGADGEGEAMTGEHKFQPGDVIRIALPGSGEDLQFVISDVRNDGGAETVSLIPDPENADVPLPWE
jgi:hypothetical protein